MKRAFLDTSAYSVLHRGDERILDALCEAETLCMSPIVLGELHVGFRAGRQRDENLRQLRRFLDKPLVAVATLTEETADIYAQVFLTLKAQGTPIPLNDVWIAAQCLEQGAVLLTLDQHFQHVPGLRRWGDSTPA